MPDWSYRTLIRPGMFALPAERARDLTLAAIGRFGSTPIGPGVIGFLGHMDPPDGITRRLMGLEFVSPVGLGAGLDPEARAIHALARFGFGFVEVGPVTMSPVARGAIERLAGPGISYVAPVANPGVEVVAARLEGGLRRLPKRVRVGVRIAATPGADADAAADELAGLVERLAPLADYLVVDPPPAWVGDAFGVDDSGSTDSGGFSSPIRDGLQRVVEQAAACEPRCPVLLLVRPDDAPSQVDRFVDAGARSGAGGFVVGGGSRADGSGGRTVGISTRAQSLATVTRIRTALLRWDRYLVIIASGGVLEPGDATEALDSGADLVQMHTGLVFSGPGLPKRINEAMHWRATQGRAQPDPVSPTRRPLPSWLGFLLLGAGEGIAGVAAWAVAATSVVLPYDLAFLGMDRAALQAVNPRLLDFLSHDRISLAGTMISIGVLYMGLTWFGVRRRVHWARKTLNLSATLGFASFFLFLAHGYFDILHAALAALLFAFFLSALRWRADGPPEVQAPDLVDDLAWRAGVFGQFAFVLIGAGLIVGGATIAVMGSTTVLVPEDLEFMSTTAEALRTANPRLIPLIAHDRAGFGGALAADGLAVLGIALWGFRRGARWIWWLLLAAGTPGVVAAIGVHAAVGYTDFWHLSPVLLLTALTAVGLALSRPYLCGNAATQPAGVTLPSTTPPESRRTR